jgi:hypothetical protein
MHHCLYCYKLFSNKGGLTTHEPYCKNNPNKKIRYRSPKAGLKKGHIPWNKGKVGLYTKEHIQKLRESGKRAKGIASTPDAENARKSKISKSMKKYGGYRRGSGRGKKGWYKGFFCDSSWELAYLIYCLDKNILIERNTKKLKYIFNGNEKNYIPDFIVDGILTEIKGFKSPQWEAKLKYNPFVKVLYKNDMKPILDYVELTYGKDYIKLYEK